MKDAYRLTYFLFVLITTMSAECILAADAQNYLEYGTATSLDVTGSARRMLEFDSDSTGIVKLQITFQDVDLDLSVFDSTHRQLIRTHLDRVLASERSLAVPVSAGEAYFIEIKSEAYQLTGCYSVLASPSATVDLTDLKAIEVQSFEP